MIQTEIPTLGQAARFCLGGAVAFIIYFTVLYGLTEYFKVWYILSAAGAFLISMGVNFLFQKFLTFQDKETCSVLRQFGQFSAAKIFFLVGNVVFLYLMVEFLHMWYILAQLILTAAAAVLSFIVTREIFRKEKQVATADQIKERLTEFD